MHLMRSEQLSKLVLVHRLRQVRDVEVGIALIGEGLELRVERFLLDVVSIRWQVALLDDECTDSCKAHFVSEVVKATDTVLGILIVVILDEAEANITSVKHTTATSRCIPFAQSVVQINDGL